MHDRSSANEAAESGPCMGSICGRKALPAAAGRVFSGPILKYVQYSVCLR